MALIISDRVKETTTTQGTGSITLNGSTFGGFNTFSQAIGSGNSTYYCIQNESNFEIGIGTVSVQSISRDTVLQSSNGGAKISLTGVSVVFCVIPAEKLVFKDINNTVQLSSDLEIDGLVSDYIYAASGDFTNGLTSNTFVSNDVNITDLSVVGSLGSSGLLTLRRTSAGNFFHAYIDDLNDRTISLYSDGITPTWKLGLKNSPLSETQSPTYAYVYATDGGFGLVGNEDNKLTISNYEPFVIKHQGVDIISGHHSTGIHIQSNSSAYPALKINGGALLSANIQEWNNSADDTLAYVDANGNFFTTGNISSTTGNFNAIRFSDSTIQSTAGLPIYSGAIINQQIVAVSGWAENYVDSQEGSTTAISGWILNSFTTISDSIALSGWLEYYVDSQDHSAVAVSGWAESTFLTQDGDSYVSGVATYASGLADQNVLDIATVSGLLSDAYDDTPISGYFESRVDFNESQITAVSGFAREYVDSQDHSATAVSGWVRDYVDSQDHSAAAVSGWADSTISAGDIAVSGWAEATFLTVDDDSYISGVAVYASGHNLQSITDNGATTNNAITINNDLTAENLFGDLYGPIVFECKNDTGSQINAGTPVYVSGYYSNNGKSLIAPAIGNDATKMPAVGILANNLTDGSEGHVHVFGEVPRIDTSSFNVGDTVYVDPTGGLVNTRPTGIDELVQNIGRVLRSDASQGKILLLGPGRTNDVPNSGSFSELSVGGSDIISQITAVSGWAESYVDSQDHSALSVSGALQPQITQNTQDIATVSGLLTTSTQTFDTDITVSLGGGKTFGRYEDGDTIPASGRTANEVISLAITEPIAPTASLTSSSSVDFNQVNVSTTLNFSHTINSLGATISSASLEFRRGNAGSWTVLSTSTSTSSSYNHTFTDTAFNTAVLNYRYTVTDSVGATITVTKDIYPDTYSAPSISFSVAAVSTTSPETNSSRERGNVNSNISGSINRNESYVDLISYTLQYSVNNGAWTDIGSAVSIGPGNSTISSTNHNPTSSNTATSIRYRVKVVDDYTTSYSSISTVSFGYLIFYGPSSSAPTTSANVRALPSRLFTTGNNTFTLNTGSTEINFTVAIPSTESISEVIDLDALNANITSQYVNNAFNVDDAGGTAVSYNVYTMTQAAAYSSNHRHQVTKG